MYDLINFIRTYKTNIKLSYIFSEIHLFIVFLIITLGIILGYIGKKHKKTKQINDKVLILIVSSTILMEIIKIIDFYALIDRLNYVIHIDFVSKIRQGNVYAPTFICSIFMWALLLYLILPTKELKQAVMEFYASYMLISGISIIIKIDNIVSLNSYLSVGELHSIIYHALMVILGIYLMLKYSLFISIGGILRSFAVLLFFVLISLLANAIMNARTYEFYNRPIANLFVISPYEEPNVGIYAMIKLFKIKDYSNKLNPIVFTIMIFFGSNLIWFILSIPHFMFKINNYFIIRSVFNKNYQTLTKTDLEICKDYNHLMDSLQLNK